MHRRSGVTCLAVHPSGHILAVGHADGSISFWAVEDDAAPLAVFTFDEDNVHLVDTEKLELHLQSQGQRSQAIPVREPVIKLAWSGYSNSTDPRGGETTLTILGGLDAARGGNATVLWFPPFQPTDPPGGQPPQAGILHPFFRAAMVESVNPIDLAEYDIDGEVQDFILVPKEHPHFAGTFDPYSILFSIANEARDRVIGAYSFPPARTTALGTKDKSTDSTVPSSLVEDLVTGPAVLPYHHLSLPFSLISGETRLTGGRILTLETAQYERIIPLGKIVGDKFSVQLEGGKAFADQVKYDEIRLTKVRRFHYLVCILTNLSAASINLDVSWSRTDVTFVCFSTISVRSCWWAANTNPCKVAFQSRSLV
jgi:WD40 repeat protein